MISEFVLVKIKEIAEIYSGNSINEKVKATKYTGLDTGIDYISTKDISFDSQINYSNGIKIPFEEAQNFKRAPKDTVFICAEGGSAGRKIALSDRELCFVNKLFAVVARNSVLPKYLYYYFKSAEFIEQFKDSMTGIIGGVSINKFKDIDVLLPPLSKQQKIVAKLDVIFAAIDKATAAAEANAKNAETLFQSYLTKIFQREDELFKAKKISEIAKIKGGKRLPKGYELKAGKTPYVYLRVSDFSDKGTIDDDNLRYVDKDVHDVIKNYIINSDDLYISIAGTIGRTGIVPKNLSGSLLTENACRLVFNEEINNRYVYYFTKSSDFISQTIEQTRTAAQPKLALSRLGEITLSIPSFDKQKSIVNQLDKLNEEILDLKDKYSMKVKCLEILKQSILREAFAGELVKE